MLDSCAKVDFNNPADGQEQTVTLSTTVPGVSTRTILGDEIGHKSISWAEKDSVKIFTSNGTASSAYTLAGVEKNGEIRVTVKSSSFKNFFGVYPHKASGKVINLTSCIGAVTVPQVQEGKFEDACLMVGWATEERVLRFHTAVSLIVIEIEDPEITQVVLRANDSTPLAGQAEFTFDKTTGEITKFTQSSGAPEIVLNVDGPGKYFVGLLPNANLKAGIGFKVKKGEKASGTLSRTPLVLKTTELMSIGKLDDKLLPDGDIFIKENGFGKGTSWSDAGGVELLNTLLDAKISETVSMDGVTSCWRLEGRKIYIAEGTYNLTGADRVPFYVTCGNGKLEVYGGFSEGSIGTDVSKYDPSKYITTFTADNAIRIMEVGGMAGGSMDFHGIDFSGANTDCDGAAVAVSSRSELNFVDCTFEQNTTTKNGAGLYVTGGNVHLTHCSFSQNQGITAIAASSEESDAFHKQTSHGGAVFATGKEADVNLYIDHCSFRNNLAFVGPDIELWFGANAYCYDSYFLSSVAQAGGHFNLYPGRSINLDAMENGRVGQFCMCNCTLTKTGSAYSSNGGLPLITATNYFLMLVNCTLHDTAVATVRNNNYSKRAPLNPDLVWLVANLIFNDAADPSKSNAVNLNSNSNRHGYYNMLRSGKNGYQELDPTDTKILENEYTSMKYMSDKCYYNWTVDEALHPINKPNISIIKDVVSTNCEIFDKWLNTISDNPYGYDQIGTLRNLGAICPGAWDKGL